MAVFAYEKGAVGSFELKLFNSELAASCVESATCEVQKLGQTMSPDTVRFDTATMELKVALDTVEDPFGMMVDDKQVTVNCDVG